MENKRMYFGTNTKMYKTPKEAVEHITRLGELIADIKDEAHFFVIPSYTSLPAAVEAAKGTGILIGAQSVGWEENGQFTGEISVRMLHEVGVDMVMVGHSERRHVFHETDFEEEKRVACATAAGFKTLLCIGEEAVDKEYGISGEVLAEQLKIGLHSLPAELAKEQLLIAYEPVWAIGVSGIPADPAYCNEMHGVIKKTLCTLYGEEIGAEIPVLYGGSVNIGNAEAITAEPNVDGLYIGRSAWEADNFNKIIRMAIDVYRQRA